MKIKKFEGKTMSEVFATVKAELGPDALIIETREVKKRRATQQGGFILVPVIEMTAAVESPEPIKKPVPEKSTGFETVLEEAVQGDIYKELQQIKDSLASLAKAPQAPELSPAPGEAKGFSKETPPLNDLHETWLEMKVMLKSLTEMQRENPVFSKNETLSHLFEQLVLSGVDAETAQHLVRAVKESLSQEDVFKPTRVQDSIHEVIQGLIKVTGPFMDDVDTTHNGPKVVALIGPTGAGKTTTAAKLGVSRRKEEKEVTLISLDDTESGGGDALIQYADQHGIPALKVASWDRLKKVVSQRKKGELVLLDTAGRSHLKSQEIGLLKALTSVGMQLETHLVLSANTKGSDLSDMIDRFSVIPIDSLLFTKIDETLTYGPLFSVMGRKRKPISYFTTGRRVPEDIELATAKRFTHLVLTGSR